MKKIITVLVMFASLASCKPGEPGDLVSLCEASEGSSVIYFFRPNDAVSQPENGATLVIDAQRVAELPVGSYTGLSIIPGRHRVTFSPSPSNYPGWFQVAEFEFMDGAIYYIALRHEDQSTNLPDGLIADDVVGAPVFRGSNAPAGMVGIRPDAVTREVAEFEITGLEYVQPLLRISCEGDKAVKKQDCHEVGRISNGGNEIGSRQEAQRAIDFSFSQGGLWTDDPWFRQLDSVVSGWTSLDCKFSDGRPKADFIRPGFSQFFNSQDPNYAYKKIKELRQARGNSAYPVCAEAEYWRNYAWQARGDGYASTVTIEGWKLFHDRLGIAEKVLVENKAIASISPCWYELMVAVQSALGKDEERDKVFYEGAERHRNYLPLYIEMRNYSEPKWGGSWEQVDNFITWASNNADKSNRQFIYANLYYGVRDNLSSKKSFFEDTKVDWEKLKAAYKEVIKKYPDSMENLTRFADLSCEANDKEAYIYARKKLGAGLDPTAWSFFHETPAACDSKFGYAR